MTALVLLPGMDGTGDLFEPFLDALRGVAPALRPVVVRYPVDRWLDDAALVAAVREVLPVGEPFLLLGESFSGPIALSLAAERPAGLHGVVLAASFARYPVRGLSLFGALAARVPLSLLPKPLMSLPLLGDFTTAALRDDLHRAVGRVAPEVMARRARQVLSVDARQAVGRIDVPVLLLRATRDRVVPASASNEIAKRARRCAVIDIEAPHMLLQCAPDAAARAIAATFEEHVEGTPHA